MKSICFSLFARMYVCIGQKYSVSKLLFSLLVCMYWPSRATTPSQSEIFCLIACSYDHKENISLWEGCCINIFFIFFFIFVGQCDLDLGSSHYITAGTGLPHTHLDRSTPTSLILVRCNKHDSIVHTVSLVIYDPPTWWQLGLKRNEISSNVGIFAFRTVLPSVN